MLAGDADVVAERVDEVHRQNTSVFSLDIAQGDRAHALFWVMSPFQG